MWFININENKQLGILLSENIEKIKKYNKNADIQKFPKYDTVQIFEQEIILNFLKKFPKSVIIKKLLVEIIKMLKNSGKNATFVFAIDNDNEYFLKKWNFLKRNKIPFIFIPKNISSEKPKFLKVALSSYVINFLNSSEIVILVTDNFELYKFLKNHKAEIIFDWIMPIDIISVTKINFKKDHPDKIELFKFYTKLLYNLCKNYRNFRKTEKEFIKKLLN